VLASKQRPCKLTIMGSDGKEYPFLLKGTHTGFEALPHVHTRGRTRTLTHHCTGHEDLRQDERVMQLFELVNTLLATDRETTNRQMAIQRYAIIPLSPHSGLIGWVLPLCLCGVVECKQFQFSRTSAIRHRSHTTTRCTN
jgi:FKBP12-rapamycin complex-associated protein